MLSRSRTRRRATRALRTPNPERLAGSPSGVLQGPRWNNRSVDQHYGDWDQMFGGLRAPEYEGLTRERAEQLASANHIERVRIDDWDIPDRPAWTLELIPSRLNLLVQAGQVVRAGWG